VFDFPNNPTNGQTVTAYGGAVYTWDGSKWVNGVNQGSGPFLPLSGGVMTGPMTTPQFNVTTVTGPNLRSGAGAATGIQPSGSIWIRTDGAVGARIYVSDGNVWNSIAGV
jgi:hypothetical protein